MKYYDYSVVATTFNDGREIIQYLDSICNQTVPPYEIIISDGGSRDDTVEKIQAYSDKTGIMITVLSGRRLNIAQGYNLAIRNVKTEYVGVTGIGNVYYTDYFEVLQKRIIAEGVDVAYSPVRGYNSTPYAVKYNKTFLNGDKGDRISIATNHGVLMKTQIFSELDFFYEKFIYAGEDAEFYQRVKYRGYKTTIVDEAISLWYTPSNKSEFYKQIKNYAIADIQILGLKKIINREKRNIIKVFISIGGAAIVLLLPAINTGLFVIAILCYILFHLLDYGKNIGKDYKMILEKRFLKLFYYFKYRKYFSEEYKVNREEM